MVFNYLGMDWDKYVIEDLSLIKRSSPNNLFGNPKKLMDQTGWKPKVNLKALVKLMVDYELKVRN